MPPIERFTATRRNLPHWQATGAVYFLTWRVVDDLVLDPEDRTIVLDAVRFWDARKWFVSAAVVMPNHAHALVRPLPVDESRPAEGPVFELGEVLGSAKRYSSREINCRRGRSGTVWQDERYDRIQRDGREIEQTREYIRNNPVKAGLASDPETYPWLYEARRAD